MTTPRTESTRSISGQPLLTPIQTAGLLGVEVQTLSVWRTKKRYGLKYVKVGRLIRYRAEDVQAFIDSRLHLGE